MSVVLYYFDLYGRGEIIRMILTHFGQNFVDNSIPKEDWSEATRNSISPEFGQLPLLEIDGLRLVETRSITRYLCQKFGCYPSDIVDIYWAESLSDLRQDIIDRMASNLTTGNTEEIGKIYREDMPWWLTKIQDRLVRNGGGDGWFVGNNLTRADFEMFQLLYDGFLREGVKQKTEVILKMFPKLEAFVYRFLENSPRIKSYLESRKIRVY